MPTQARTANVSFLIKNSLHTEYKPLNFFRHFYIFFGSKALASCSRHCEFCLDFLIFFFPNGTVDPHMPRQNISDKPSIPAKFFLLNESSLFSNYAHSFREHFSVLSAFKKTFLKTLPINRALRMLKNLTKGGQIMV